MRAAIRSLLAVAALSTLAQAQPVQQASNTHPITMADIRSWNAMRGATLSNDGKWFAYVIGPADSNATLVVSRGTGILAICSDVRIVVDSTDETSMGLTAPVPTTVTVSRLVGAPPALTKSTFAAVPTFTLTVRGLPPLRVTVYWPMGTCANR